MSYTKGPWRVHSTANEALAIYSGFRRVATVPHSDREGLPEDEANAKLIAAAPELLEALQLLTKQCDQWHNGKGAGSLSYWAGPGREAALAAIEKAREGHDGTT